MDQKRINSTEDLLNVFSMFLSMYTIGVFHPKSDATDYVFDSGVSAILRYSTGAVSFFHSNGYYAYSYILSRGDNESTIH